MSTVKSPFSRASGKAGEHRQRPHLDWRVIGGLMAVTLFLILGQVLTFTQLQRHQLPGEPLLESPAFEEDFAGWEVRGEVGLDPDQPGRMVIENSDPEQTVGLSRVIELPPGRRTVRVAARIQTESVYAGIDFWQTARIYLVQLDAAGEADWNQPHNLFLLAGSNPWQDYAGLYDIPGGVDRAELSLELNHATGRFEIEDFQLTLAEERPLFRLAAALLVCCWSLLAFYCGTAIYHSIRDIRIRFWVVVSFAVMIAGIFMPSMFRQQMIDALASGFGLTLGNPDALAHRLVFGTLAFLVRLGRPRDPLLLHFAAWLLLGAATESLQLFTPDRTMQFADWTANVVGVGIGLALAEILPRLVRRFEPKDRSRHPFG
jgi:hypothetical protein